MFLKQKDNAIVVLSVKIGNDDTREITVVDTIKIGDGPRNDFNIPGYDLPTLAAKVQLQQNGVVSLIYLGEDTPGSINKSPVEHGRRYILSPDDIITIGDVKISVLKREKEKKDKIELDKQEKVKSPTKRPRKVRLTPPSSTGPSFAARLSSFFLTLTISFAIVVHILPTTGWQNMIDEKYNAHQEIVINQFADQLGAKKGDVDPNIYQESITAKVTATVVDLIVTTFPQKMEPIQESIKNAPDRETVVKHFITQFNQLKHIILTIICFIAIDLLSHLVLSTSLALFLCSATTRGGFIDKRIKALLRWTISLVTTPLLIFDLPALAKKRTFKEFITGSRIEYRSQVVNFISSKLLIPIVQLTAIIIPVLLHLDIVNNPYKITSETIEEKKDNSDIPSKTVSSYIFKMQSSDKHIFGITQIPTLTKVGTKMVPAIQFIDDKTQTNVELAYLGNMQLTKELSKIAKMDMFFQMRSKALAQYLITSAETPPKEKKEQPSDQVLREYQDLIQQVLTLSPQTLPKFIWNRGILFRYYINLRKLISDAIGMLSADIVPEQFKIYKNESGGMLEIKINNRDTIYTRFSDLNFPLIRLRTKEQKSRLKTGITNLLKMSSPIEYDRETMSAIALSKYDSFKTLDTMSIFNEEPPTKDEVRQIKEYYLERARQIIKRDSDYLKLSFSKAIKNIDIHLKSINKEKYQNLNKQISHLNYALNRIQDAVERGDSAFFEANQATKQQ